MTTVISPTNPENVQSTDAPKPKRQRKTELKPLFEAAEGVKFEVTPDNLNPETHRMAKKQFKDIPCFMEHQALMHEFHAKKLREAAAEYRINPPKKAAGAKKAKLMEKLSKLEAKLKELGINVEDLFGDDASA